MLTELRISGLGVITEAVLEPHPGLTVVTGETGAGKTMVVTALGLAGGGRADAARVRAGVDRAVVETRWQATETTLAAEALGQAVESAGGQLDDDGSVICLRSVSAEGRSRAHLGGRAVPLAVLNEVTDSLLAVHGQSEAISLLQPTVQRAMLDRFAGTGELVAAYRQARARWQQAAAELADRMARSRELAQREQILRLGLAEIAAVAPLPGEDAELVATVKRLENVDTVRAAAVEATQALAGSDADTPNVGAIAGIETASRALVGSGDPRLAEWKTALQQAISVLTEVASDVGGYLADLDADPELLQQTLSRQAELRAVERRFGADTDEVLAWAAAAETELASLDTSEAALRQLAERVADLAVETGRVAGELSARRSAAAAELGTAVTAELMHLAMARATVRVAVTQRGTTEADHDALPVGTGKRRRWLHAGSDGVDQVEIVMTAHSGAPELPIGKGASGGELSRVMLALEVVLAGADPVGTLVFDEVDAGVGGRAATEIGRRLALLASTHQVIVVTHLAQVAAFADRHYVVDAGADAAVGVSSVRVVSDDDRCTELARMLGGTDTESALAHAADLLAAASG